MLLGLVKVIKSKRLAVPISQVVLPKGPGLFMQVLALAPPSSHPKTQIVDIMPDISQNARSKSKCQMRRVGYGGDEVENGA